MIFGSKITRSDLQVSLREVAPGPIFGVSGREVASDFGFASCRLAIETRATSGCRFGRSLREGCEMRATSVRRSGQVALASYGMNMASDFTGSL
ncbi:hypothetical protein YC2023_111472 [Brassica napus]